MSAEQAVGIAVGALLLGAFLLLLLLLSGGVKPVKQPVVQPVKDPVDEAHDGYQRAQYFTEEAMAAGPSIVAGQDLNWADRRGAALVELEFRLLVDESLKDVDTDVARLTPFYLVPEQPSAEQTVVQSRRRV